MTSALILSPTVPREDLDAERAKVAALSREAQTAWNEGADSMARAMGCEIRCFVRSLPLPLAREIVRSRLAWRVGRDLAATFERRTPDSEIHHTLAELLIAGAQENL